MSISLTCQCCRKILKMNDSRIQTTQKSFEIFRRFIGFDLLDGIICGKCNACLLTFDAFQRDIKQKYSALYEAINGIAQIYCDEKLQDFEEEEEEVEEEEVEEEKLEQSNQQVIQPEIKIKQEPVEHKAVTTEKQTLIDVKHIKTEPEEEPQQWINTNNVIVKEEYEIKEDFKDIEEVEEVEDIEDFKDIEEVEDFKDFKEVEDVEDIVEGNVHLEEVDNKEAVEEFLKTQEELEAESILSLSKELVLKANVKRSIRVKCFSAPKRYKSLALSIPNESIRSFDKSIIETVIVRDAFLADETSEHACEYRENLKKALELSRSVQFKCEHCTVISRSRELVVRHIKEAHAYLCNVCRRIFPTKFKMDRHKEGVHNMNPQTGEGSRRKQNLQPKKEDKMMMFRLRSNQ